MHLDLLDIKPNRNYSLFLNSPFPSQLLYSLNCCTAGRPGSSEVPRNPLTRWDVSSIPANGIFLTKKLKKLKCPAGGERLNR